MIDAAGLIGSHDVLMITFDTLRYDVARDTLAAGRTPNLARVLPGGVWEERHSPGSFTYAAHQSIFGGFFPTPATPGKHTRPFAMRFPGSETIGPETCVLDSPDLVTGLAVLGYHTICVGGVGFFNKLGPLGSVLPNLFAESHWSPDLGVTDPDSFLNQCECVEKALANVPPDRRVFLFVNISAIHQPNSFYLEGAETDSIASHGAALIHVDRHLPRIFSAMSRRGDCLTFLMSDHGTAYGEGGFQGHRLAHPVVWTVPYAEFLLPGSIR